ncbi:hypothetical protein TNCV_4231401 [Trichonephila clavipes]|uniref:Uncharacterized protein n=1 Tax=Trichonephila clavipes TaxID=2585209 RepID=A0A8X6SGA2_TRICX|nr:hypothetical protein TNCV_4231401 [Trichonephila clavipes]
MLFVILSIGSRRYRINAFKEPDVVKYIPKNKWAGHVIRINKERYISIPVHTCQSFAADRQSVFFYLAKLINRHSQQTQPESLGRAQNFSVKLFRKRQEIVIIDFPNLLLIPISFHSGSFAMREKGDHRLVPGPDFMVDALKLPNQDLRDSGESLQKSVAWRCPDGTRHLFCWPILVVSG